MPKFRSSGGQSETTARRRAATTLAAMVGTLAFATALSVPAGAVGRPAGSGFGPHNPGVSPHASVRAHDIAPLTLANIVVTDLNSGDATVASYTNVAPITPSSMCNDGRNLLLCLGFGTPSSANGGSFDLSAGTLQAGQTYTTGVSVTAGASTCSSLNASDAATAELDQYVFNSGQLQTAAVQFDCTSDSVDISGTIAYNITPTDPSDGYYIYGQAGEIAGFGNDNYLDYLNGAQYYDLNSPIVGMAPTPDGGGYWMVGSDGGVFASGDAGFYGSTGNLHLNEPVVGMAATPDGKGYWFVATDGGIFAYGDAGFYGSRGGQPLNKPIVGMASTPDGKGYWLVASDGGIFAYGDAGFFGSTGNLHLNKPVVGLTPTPSGQGYWFVASDGGIFAYGDAGFYGSTGNIRLNQPIEGMTATPDGKGYWFVASDGGVFTFGSAAFAGSLGGTGVTDVAGMSLGGRPAG